MANDYQYTNGKNVNATFSKNKATLISAVNLPFLEKGLLEYMEGEELTEFVGNSIYSSIVTSFGVIFAPKIAGMLLDERAKIDFYQLLVFKNYFINKQIEAFQLVMGSPKVLGELLLNKPVEEYKDNFDQQV